MSAPKKIKYALFLLASLAFSHATGLLASEGSSQPIEKNLAAARQIVNLVDINSRENKVAEANPAKQKELQGQIKNVTSKLAKTFFESYLFEFAKRLQRLANDLSLGEYRQNYENIADQNQKYLEELFSILKDLHQHSTDHRDFSDLLKQILGHPAFAYLIKLSEAFELLHEFFQFTTGWANYTILVVPDPWNEFVNRLVPRVPAEARIPGPPPQFSLSSSLAAAFVGF